MLLTPHFTCRLWWRFIETEGIIRGEAPVGLNRVLNHPNLTSDPEPSAQVWTAGHGVVNKLAVRIRVNVPTDDPLLVPWIDLAKQHGIKSRELAALLGPGGYGKWQWWIYRGAVPPSMFTTVEFLDGGQVGECEQSLLASASGATSSEEARQLLGETDTTKLSAAQLRKAAVR